MKFLAINPQSSSCEVIEGETPRHAVSSIGIDPSRTDHGTITRGLAIIVYEFGLLEPHWAEFFTIGKQLFVGKAIVYQYDERGETIDITGEAVNLIRNNVAFYHSRAGVEAGIERGNIERPEQSVTSYKDGIANKSVTWTWKP